MTPATTIREILAPDTCGMAGIREAKQLAAHVEKLTWKTVDTIDGVPVDICRHCQLPRAAGHATYCPANE